MGCQFYVLGNLASAHTIKKEDILWLGFDCAMISVVVIVSQGLNQIIPSLCPLTCHILYNASLFG